VSQVDLGQTTVRDRSLHQYSRAEHHYKVDNHTRVTEHSNEVSTGDK